MYPSVFGDEIREITGAWTSFIANDKQYKLYIEQPTVPVELNYDDIFTPNVTGLEEAVADVYLYSTTHSQEELVAYVNSGVHDEYEIYVGNLEGTTYSTSSGLKSLIGTNYVDRVGAMGEACVQEALTTARMGAGHLKYYARAENVQTPQHALLMSTLCGSERTGSCLG